MNTLDAKFGSTMNELEVLAGKHIQYSKDGGKNWKLALLDDRKSRYKVGGEGFGTNEELIPDSGTWRFGITELELEQGNVLFREALPSEYEGRKFSYQ
ncbi:MAG: hypothetical protein AABX35_02340 [Nanoarchaeota archaeon]